MKDKPTITPPPPEGFFTSFTSGGGYNLSAKGYNQAYNQNEEVITENSPKGYNQENDMWLSRKEVEDLLGISQPAILKAIKKGRFKVIETYGNGGRQYRIALSSLPAQAQIKYLQAHPELIQSAMKINLSNEAISWVISHSIPDKETETVRVTDMDKAWAVKEYLKYGSFKAAKAIADKLGVDVSTVYRWVHRAEKEAERLRNLSVEGTPVTIKLPPRMGIPEELFIQSLSVILSSQGKRAKNGWQYVINNGHTISYSQYTRLLQAMTPPFKKILSYHRSGRISALLTETPKVIRAWTELPVMSTIVGDQHYLDYYFYSPELDDVVKIQLYFWADCSSRYFVSCVPIIGQQYTQWHVQASLAEAFRIHVPDEIYTDWGKQENSKFTSELIDRLSAGRIFLGNWDDFLEKYPEARITRKHSTPCVPPVKPIESFIRRFTEYLNQEGLTGYHKRDTNDPFRNKEIQDSLKIAIKQGKLLSLEEGLDAIRGVIEKCNTTTINTQEGKSFIPAQFLWRGLRGRRIVIPDDELALFFPAFIRKVRNASVQVKIGSKTVVFTAKELTWVRDGEEVLIRVNPFPPHEGSQFYRLKGEDWKYLAPAQAWIGFGVDPREQEKLQKAMEVKNHYLKQFVLAIREIHKRSQGLAGVEDEPARKFTDAIRHKQEGFGELVFLDKPEKKDKNWEALGRLAEIYGY